MTDSQATQTDEQARAAMAEAVWSEEGATAPTEEPAASAAAQTEASKEAATDPWEGVPAHLKTEIEGLRAQVSSVSTLEMRLKQAEHRLGGVQNELHAAKTAAKEAKNAPTSAQIAEAAATQAEWDSLKTDFPEWAAATEGKMAVERAAILKLMPDVSQIRSEHAADLEKLRIQMLGSVVAIKHPDWKTVNNSPEFNQWRTEQGGIDSDDPNEVIAILDNYAAYKSSKKSPKEIAAERDARLEQAQTTQTSHKVRIPKSEADMTPAEIRASIAKGVWA